MNVSKAAAVLGRLGGLKKSKRKTEAVRANAKLPRPGRRKKSKKAKKTNNVTPMPAKTTESELTAS